METNKSWVTQIAKDAAGISAYNHPDPLMEGRIYEAMYQALSEYVSPALHGYVRRLREPSSRLLIGSLLMRDLISFGLSCGAGFTAFHLTKNIPISFAAATTTKFITNAAIHLEYYSNQNQLTK